MKLTRNEALGVLDGEIDETSIVDDRLVDSSRWSLVKELIFKWTDGKFYKTYYSIGATEDQDEGPWEYEGEVECKEVHELERTVKVWEEV